MGAIGGSGGANYVNGETVTLTGGAGSSGATATVAVNGSGAVTGVTLTNPGTGYIAGEVLTIVGATGSTGATIAVSSLRAGS